MINERLRIEEICSKASSNLAQKKLGENRGSYPVFGASGFIQNIDSFHQEHPYIGIVKDGAGVGRVNIYPAKSSLLGTMQYIIPKSHCDLVFLAYALKSLDLSSFANGAAIPHIYFKDYGKCKIPVPPLSEQKRIVEELDLLSGIIEKQKQQLKELDTLAQSIFYDMFGDPVLNEKGWEVKKLGEVSINLDSYRKPVTKADRQPGPYPYYGASGIVDYVSNFIFDGIYLLVSEDGANLLTRNQPIAFLSHGKVWINNHAHVLDFKDHSSKIYLMFYLNLLDLKDRVKGAAQPKLTQKDLNDINLSWPPLQLQNLFAAKIEAIEKQKEAITKSIEETQKLFDYTMDKYFG